VSNSLLLVAVTRGSSGRYAAVRLAA